MTRYGHMKVEDIKKYCMEKQCVTEEYPFGDALISICYKLNGKIFAQIYPYEDDYKITVKCTVDAGQFYRRVYPGKVVRGYHCPTVQQPYWNTIYLDDFPDEELLNMIDLAYDTVFSKFSKKEQILMLHSQLIEATGGSDGIRDEGMLESAISTSFPSFAGEELYPSVQPKAAQLCYGLVKNHPMIDGNKRIRTHVMLIFLALSGYK